MLHTVELVAKPAPAMTSGPPLDTDTIAAIVTGKLSFLFCSNLTFQGLLPWHAVVLSQCPVLHLLTV